MIHVYWSAINPSKATPLSYAALWTGAYIGGMYPSHVNIGDDNVVYVPESTHPFWPRLRFEQNYPNLYLRASLGPYDSLAGTDFRIRLDRALVGVHCCVRVAVRILDGLGYRVSAFTPGGLYRELNDQQADFSALG